MVSYDYAAPGAYFFTIVTRGRLPRFGSIIDDDMRLSIAGTALIETWDSLPNRFGNIELDAFVVMPNHVHGVVWLVETENEEAHALGDVIGALKSLSTRAVNKIGNGSGPLWQRNYFERIVRNERELHAVRRYIDENPLRWALDHENPDYVEG